MTDKDPSTLPSMRVPPRPKSTHDQIAELREETGRNTKQLVAHANELDELNLVIADESRRRRKPFPIWVPDAGPGDWERLGRDYLARTARWREERPVFTDKGLTNWGYVGALEAMLPGARLVNTRRDPVENCLACFRQSFARELVASGGRPHI